MALVYGMEGITGIVTAVTFRMLSAGEETVAALRAEPRRYPAGWSPAAPWPCRPRRPQTPGRACGTYPPRCLADNLVSVTAVLGDGSLRTFEGDEVALVYGMEGITGSCPSSTVSGCTTISGRVRMNFFTTSGRVPMSWLYTTRRTSTVLARSPNSLCNGVLR